MITWRWLQQNRSRFFKWTTIMGSFALVQIVVQLFVALTGFILVRSLEKQEYAWLTIANAMGAALNILSDAGIGGGVTSLAGKFWQDRPRLSMLIHQALRMRFWLTLIACTLVMPFSFWLLRKNSASLLQSALLTALVLLPIWPVTSTAILSTVNRMHSRYREIQSAEILSALTRLALIGCGAAAGALNSLLAVISQAVAVVFQNRLVIRQTNALIIRESDLEAGDDFTPELKKVMVHFYPYALFYCIQGQMATWLISVYAKVEAVADLGALNRLAIILTVVGAPLNQVVGPAFARCKDNRRLLKIFATAVGGYAFFGALMLAAALFNGQWLLWILGEQYGHLHQELPIVFGGFCLGGMTSVVMMLSMAKGWVRHLWLNMPVTLAAQVVGILVLDLSTVRGVGWFGVLTCAGQLALALVLCAVNFLNSKQAAAKESF